MLEKFEPERDAAQPLVKGHRKSAKAANKGAKKGWKVRDERNELKPKRDQQSKIEEIGNVKLSCEIEEKVAEKKGKLSVLDGLLPEDSERRAAILEGRKIVTAILKEQCIAIIMISVL